MVTAQTPEEAAYEVPAPTAEFTRWYRVTWPDSCDGDRVAKSWHRLSDAEREFWAAVAAREPQPAPELAEQVKQLAVTLRRISGQQEASGHPEGAYATGCAATMVESLIPPPGCGCTVCEATGSPHGVPQPAPASASQVRRHEAQAAPELPPRWAAMDPGEVRDLVEQASIVLRPALELAAAMAVTRRVLEWFEGHPGSSYRTATVTRAQLAAAWRDGGLLVPEDLRKFLGKPKGK